MTNTNIFASLNKVTPDTLPRVGEWRDHAACIDADPDLFFPDGTTGRHALQAEEAKAVCATCPVIMQCRTWALTHGQDSGVWGGLTEQERRRIHRRKARAPMAAQAGPRSLEDVLNERSTVVDGGHRVWTGTNPVTIHQKCYSPSQLAWWVAYGEAPQGEIRSQCGHSGCIDPGHALDAVGRAEQHGRHAAWKAHKRVGEPLCTDCQVYQDTVDEARRQRERKQRRERRTAA